MARYLQHESTFPLFTGHRALREPALGKEEKRREEEEGEEEERREEKRRKIITGLHNLRKIFKTLVKSGRLGISRLFPSPLPSQTILILENSQDLLFSRFMYSIPKSQLGFPCPWESRAQSDPQRIKFSLCAVIISPSREFFFQS